MGHLKKRLMNIRNKTMFQLSVTQFTREEKKDVT